MYVQVRVPRGPVQTRPAIPEDAIQTGQEGRFVFVVGEKNIVEKRLVELGPTIWKAPSRPNSHGGWALVNPDPKPPAAGVKGPPPPTRMRVNSVVSINSGLSPEDRVIVVGLQKARPMAPVTPEDWQLLPPDVNKPTEAKK
jgi:multidrug efflux pump subunit AcrA (membrane-fusion protein)